MKVWNGFSVTCIQIHPDIDIQIKNWILYKCRLLQSVIPGRGVSWDETERKVVLCQRQERETIDRLITFGIL